MSDSFYNLLLNIELLLSIVIFILLSFITAPYGRFVRKGWGPEIKSRTAWILMEMPSLVIPILFFLISPYSLVSLIFLIIWMSHYVHRTIIYPFRISDPEKPFSIVIMSWGFLFNMLNSVINFYFLFFIRININISWLLSWKFLLGLAIFAFGFILNKNSDSILRSLRIKNKNSYSIPQGGFYKWISAPNYLGEILEWGGWALLTWSLAGTAFFLFTIANLAPRAIMIHKWYKNNFEEYPEGRKAILPFIY